MTCPLPRREHRLADGRHRDPHSLPGLYHSRRKERNGMALLTGDQIRQRLTDISGWVLEGNEIRKTYSFSSFALGMSFVNRVADLAEAANHHPDIDVRYDRVTLALSTHSEGGITKKDLDLAARIEALPR
jgi:4a-hydroxytetrahydrobiopterin dehydratase